MNIILAIIVVVVCIKMILVFINKKPIEKTWKNKPWNEELTHEEKRLLILRINEVRSIDTRYGWERHEKDIHFYHMLDRFAMSVTFGSLSPDQAIPMSGEMVSATPNVIKSSRDNAARMYEIGKNEYQIDLYKLAQKDLAGADLSKDPLL